MAREPVPHLGKKRAIRVQNAKSPTKRNGPRSNGDRFKAKTPIRKRRGDCYVNFNPPESA